MPQALRAREQTRVRVFAHDPELRAWLVDELALMSPFGSVEVEEIDALDAAGSCDVLIAGLENVTADEAVKLRELIAQHVFVIAIGAPQAVQMRLDFRCVLDTKLTSRQLKRAVRDIGAR